MYAAIDREVYIYRLKAALEEIGALIVNYRFKKSLLVFDRQTSPEVLNRVKSGLTQQGVEYLLFETDDVTFRLIDEGYRICLFEKIDSVIGIGGLSALNAAKGINLLRFNGGSIQKYTHPSTRRNPGSGLFCVLLVDGTDEELLLTLTVRDNDKQESFTVDCYCNYYIQVIETK